MNKKTFYFVSNFYYYSGKYGIDKYILKQDNRIDTECQVEYVDKKHITSKDIIQISCNSKKINKWSYNMILADVLHEIGHIIQDLQINTFEEEVESEYQAERFALLELQKINYDAFLEDLNYITSRKCYTRLYKKKQKSPHLEAYKKIRKEFKQYLYKKGKK